MLVPLATDAEFEFALVKADRVLIGPTYDQNPVSASPKFKSSDTHCAAPLCSRLHMSDEGSTWTLHDMLLVALRRGGC